MDPDGRQEGRIIAGRYRLDGEIDRGGMGSVFRAEHLALRAPVAIKLLDPSIGEDPEMLERFMREARSAAALRSMHVVQIFDYGVDDGVPFIAMELLIGDSLRDRLARVGRLTVDETLRVFTHVSRAVAKAHEAGIIHRDLKPDNVFLVKDDDEETAKVLDFGIAKVDGTRLPDTDNIETLGGRVLGTPHYMSPEQARGETTIDHRSDLWTLAVIAFECLTATKPFDSGAVGDLILRICTEEAPVPSRRAPVPVAFDAWFAKGVSKAPQDRFRSAKEMSEALVAALAPGRAFSGPPSPVAATSDPVLTVTPTLVSTGLPEKSLPTLTERASAQDVSFERRPARKASRRAIAMGAAALVGAGLLVLRPAAPPHIEAAATGRAPAAEERREAVSTRAEPAATAPSAVPVGSATAPVLAPVIAGNAAAKGPGARLPSAARAAQSIEARAASARVRSARSAASAPEPEAARSLVPGPAPRGDGRDIFSDRE